MPPPDGIKRIDYQPNEMKYVEDKSIFFELSTNLGKYAYIGMSFDYSSIPICVWHAAFLKRLTVSMAKHFFDKGNIGYLINFAKGKGAKQIVASNENISDSRWPKMIKKVGFKKPVLISVMEV